MAYTGKVALVTGGGSGMGQRAAQRLAATGANVAALDVNEAGLAETAKRNANIQTYVTDIANTTLVQETVDKVESDLGPIDRVINAAAILPFGKLIEQDAAIQIKQMDINYGGLVNISRATMPLMVERGRGEFISFSSMAGLLPGLLTGAYAATKAAVAMYTEILHHENLTSGVKVVCVCPPPVATPLWQQAEVTVMPKVIAQAPVIEADEVLDDIESALEKGQFWVMSGKQARFGWWMRRLVPGITWKIIHRTEGW